MKGRVLVIEKGLRAVQCAAFNAGELEIVEYFRYDGADLKETAILFISELAKKGIRPAKTLLSIHSSFLSMRIVDIPITERRKLNEVVSLQADDLFVKGLEGLVIDAIPLRAGRAAVVGIEKDELTGQLKALSGAGMSVSWAGPAILSKGLLLKRLSEGQETSALIDDDSITVIREGEPVFFKHLDSADDLLLSLAALDADGINVEKFYSAGKARLAEEAGLSASLSAGADVYPSLLAVAMQFNKGLKDSVDFLKWHADPKIETALRSRLRLSVALVLALALSWGAYSYFRYQNIAGELSSIESRMEKEYGALFPGDRPKNPDYALEVKIKELARERGVLSGRVDALKAMKELSGAARGTTVRVHELEAAGDRVNISSEAASYEEAAAFREAASKGTVFKKVLITETKPGPNSRVRFTMSAQMETP
ncbi:MAG: hypothetical protein HYV23_02915 [Deltaproteobacteria bacterium]|nr:hypothetical protein [Deltaproteobacteria bacterium]